MKMLKTLRSLACLAVVVSMVQARPLVAQGQDDGLREALEPHPAADEAIARLKSPYCPGLVDWVLSRHGEEYLAYPRASGTGLIAWLVPPAVIILGIVAVVVALRYMRRGAPLQETAAGTELSSEEEERLREAMKEMDSAEKPVF
jgi:hypothetical protein